MPTHRQTFRHITMHPQLTAPPDAAKTELLIARNALNLFHYALQLVTSNFADGNAREGLKRVVTEISQQNAKGYQNDN